MGREDDDETCPGHARGGVDVIVPFITPKVNGLSDTDADALTGLLRTWNAKRPRNVLRQEYLDAKNKLDDLEVSIPPQMRDRLGIVMGWPEQAVYKLAVRIMWDGVVSPQSETDPFELNETLDENRFDVEFPQGVASSLTHSCAFVSTTKTDEGVSILHHSAEWASATWDRKRRSLGAAVTITETDEWGSPVELVLFTATDAITCRRDANGWSQVDHRSHGLSRVPVEPLVYRPSLDRPLGRSRISRQVMSITDRALRAATRMDVSSEFYMAPQLFLMGADESAFLDAEGNSIPLWTWIMGRVKSLSKDEDGELPKLEQVSQQSMQPYTEQLRQLAAEFSGATSIPMSSLGIVQDNPASAEAIYAAKEDLVVEAANANRVYGHALKRVYQNVVMLREGLVEVTPELATVATRWRNPAMPSVVSQSDAMVKQIAAIPWLAETTVALEELGYTDEQILRLLAEKRRAAGGSVLDKLAAAKSIAAADTPEVAASVAPPVGEL